MAIVHFKYNAWHPWWFQKWGIRIRYKKLEEWQKGYLEAQQQNCYFFTTFSETCSTVHTCQILAQGPGRLILDIYHGQNIGILFLKILGIYRIAVSCEPSHMHQRFTHFLTKGIYFLESFHNLAPFCSRDTANGHMDIVSSSFDHCLVYWESMMISRLYSNTDSPLSKKRTRREIRNIK